jgi:hypothetical protein
MQVPTCTSKSGSRLLIVPTGMSSAVSADGATVAEAITDVQELVTTAREEHAQLRQSLAQIGRQARGLAAAMDCAMHPDVAGTEFWADFAGWFAMFSLVPLLATEQMLQDVVAQSRWESALITESVRDLAWWSGKSHFLPVAADVLDRAGVSYGARPGRLLRGLRGLLLPTGAGLIGRRELADELALTRDGMAGAEADIQPCDLLFAGAGASSAQIIARLWEPLRGGHQLRCAVLDLHHDRFTHAISGQGIPRHDLGQFFDQDDVRAARSLVFRWPVWQRHFEAHADEVPGWPELSGGLRTAISERVKMSMIRHLPLMRLRKTGSERALETLQPRVVTAFHTYSPATVALVRAAREAGVATVVLQHGVIGDWYLISPAQQFDEALVWGSGAQKMYSDLLGPQVPVTQTGHSLYDEAVRLQGSAPESVSRWREGKRALVVLASQPNEQQFYTDYAGWWIGAVAEACAQLQAALVIKLHPADTNHNLYLRALQTHPETVTISEHGTVSLPELIAACDALVTRDSTVVFEANLLDKPAITVNLTGRDDWFPYADLGGSVGIYQREDILPLLKQVLFDGPYRAHLAHRRAEFLADQVGPTDGEATQRIAAILARHAGSSR